MRFKSINNIPVDRPLTRKERRDLYEELQDAKARLACSEAMLEIAREDTKDEIKKEILRQLELTRKAIASLGSVE